MRIFGIILMVLSIAGLPGCRNRPAQEADSATGVKTPVTTSAVDIGSISETISLNATSAFLRKSEIKSPVSGYIQKAFFNIGDQVKTGDLLFGIKTKEAEALSQLQGNDSLMAIRGEVAIPAPATGVITSIVTQNNSYVNDGDPLAALADQNSFVFMVHVPFEFRQFTSIGSACEIILPDSTRMKGIISARLSEVDPASQTQSYLIKPQSSAFLPENLIVTVEFIKKTRENTQIVEKSCVLSDETMDNFWVMKLIDDSTAVKVPVQTGIASDARIEIVSPALTPGDRLINSGHYGLPDTARIVISK